MIRNYPFPLFSLLFLSIIFISGCGKKDTALREERRQIPQGLILEKIISGEILGKRLSRPFGVAADAFNNIYLVDAGNHRLIKFNHEFEPIGEAGGFGSGDGFLNNPSYIAVGNDLDLYVSDVNNQRIACFNTRMNFVENIEYFDSEDPLKFGRPAGVATTSFGELFVVDEENSKIAIFENYSSFNHFVGDSVEAYFSPLLTPSAIAVDGQGNIYVTDPGNSNIAFFDDYEDYLGEFGNVELKNPSGIDIDAVGNIWVVDSDLPAIICIGASGRVLLNRGTSGDDTDFGFNQPFDLAVLDSGYLAVSDSGNDRLLVYKIVYSE